MTTARTLRQLASLSPRQLRVASRILDLVSGMRPGEVRKVLAPIADSRGLSVERKR